MIGVNGMLPPALTHDEDYVAFDAGYHPAPIIATSIILGHAERNRPFGPPGHVNDQVLIYINPPQQPLVHSLLCLVGLDAT